MTETIQLVADILALIVVIIAAVELYQVNKHSKSQRAYEMIDRFWSNCFKNEHEMMNIASGAHERMSFVHYNPTFLIVTNYFEELGHMWISNHIDKKIVDQNFGKYVIEALKFHKLDIVQVRKEQNRKFCKKWEQMLSEIKKYV